MRVLFTTFAATAHMRSQAPLAWALRTAGHEVVLASQPDLAELIARAGLTAVSVGEPLNLEARMAQLEEGIGEGDDDGDGGSAGLDITETRPEKLTWDYLLGVFASMTAFVFQNQCPEPMVDDLVGFCRSWRPDLVIWDTLTFAGPVAARACGAAHARLLFGLDHVARMRAAFCRLNDDRPPELREDPLAEWLDFTARRHGGEFAEEMVTGQWSIDPLPAWMRLPLDLHCLPMRHVPCHGPSAVPDWLREPPSRRRVCLTLGVSHREVQGGDEAPVGDLLDAVADLDVEVVATLDARQLGSRATPPPDNVRVVDFVPLDVLLPTCAAIVSHGGSGTMATALAHGVPQLVVPSAMWDAEHKARRLAERGAGLVVGGSGGSFSAAELRRGLIRLLEEPSFAANADRLRRQALGAPSPNDIVPALERLTALHRVR